MSNLQQALYVPAKEQYVFCYIVHSVLYRRIVHLVLSAIFPFVSPKSVPASTIEFLNKRVKRGPNEKRTQSAFYFEQYRHTQLIFTPPYTNEISFSLLLRCYVFANIVLHHTHLFLVTHTNLNLSKDFHFLQQSYGYKIKRGGKMFSSKHLQIINGNFHSPKLSCYGNILSLMSRISRRIVLLIQNLQLHCNTFIRFQWRQINILVSNE